MNRLVLKIGILSVQMMRIWYGKRQDWSRREPIVKINDQKMKGFCDTSDARLVEYTLPLKPSIGSNSTMPRPKAAIRRTSWHLSCHECRELSPAFIHFSFVRGSWRPHPHPIGSTSVGGVTNQPSTRGVERFSAHQLHDASRDICGSFESGTELVRVSGGQVSYYLGSVESG